MRNHLISVGLGLVMTVVGLVLWLVVGEVQLPVISPGKLGVVLVVLGVVEMVVSGVALALPSTRHRNSPL